jgi:hypothetical protein
MTLTYKQYLMLLALTISSLLVIIAIVNYKVDPAMIYHKNDELKYNSANTFANRLIISSNGLFWPTNSWNERDIKKSLAKNNNINASCAVIGSSHVMEISSFRSNVSLKHLCPSIVNLGVSGGTLEDYLALSQILISKKNKTKTIVFGIDVWALDFGRDLRWERYKKSYNLMKLQLKQNSSYESDNFSKYITNLINPQYFYRSLQAIGMTEFEIEETPKFDLSQGLKYPVCLPDGSLAYSKEYISDSNASKIPIGGLIYKIENSPQYSDAAILLFKKLVRLLRGFDINVVILMTPYHHRVWESEHSVTTQALLEMEPQIRRIGKELNVKVLGSYNPYKIGCNTDEFHDHMHAKDSCLAKIKN